MLKLDIFKWDCVYECLVFFESNNIFGFIWELFVIIEEVRYFVWLLVIIMFWE